MQSEGRGMEDTSELAGNLLAELLVVREDCRMRVISEREALKRISAIRRRARSGDEGYRRPQPAPMLFNHQQMAGV